MSGKRAMARLTASADCLRVLASGEFSILDGMIGNQGSGNNEAIFSVMASDLFRSPNFFLIE